jgi:cell division GTPase FtsZ
MSEIGERHHRWRRSDGERRAHRAAEAAIANPLFDDALLKGAGGLLISMIACKDLTLYEVDEAASRIREEVDKEANIIVARSSSPLSSKRCGCRSSRRASISRPIAGWNTCQLSP